MPFRLINPLPLVEDLVRTDIDQDDIMQVSHLDEALSAKVVSHLDKVGSIAGTFSGESIGWFVTSEVPEITAAIMKYHSVVAKVSRSGKVILYGTLNTRHARVLMEQMSENIL